MRWLIYGANGYTGRLIVERALGGGIDLGIGGRTPMTMVPLGKKYQCDVELFDLEDPKVIAKHLAGYDGVLHCAGPFSKTCEPMLKACLASRTHYLDITGEIDVFEHIFAKQKEIKDAGICAVPGVGFDVVPTDAIACALAHKLPQATHLNLAFRPSRSTLSRGTARTAFESLGRGSKVRSAGKLKRIGATSDVTKIKYAPEDNAPTLSVSIPWGDVSTAFHQTGIPNIKVYSAITKTMLTQLRITQWLTPFLKAPGIRGIVEKRFLPQEGPSPELREKGHIWVYGEATDGFRSLICRLKTPEGYHFTALSAVEAMVRMGINELKPGAYTPTQAFGGDFVTTLPGVSPFLFEEPPTMAVDTKISPQEIEIGAIEVPDPGPTIH